MARAMHYVMASWEQTVNYILLTNIFAFAYLYLTQLLDQRMIEIRTTVILLFGNCCDFWSYSYDDNVKNRNSYFIFCDQISLTDRNNKYEVLIDA